MSHDRSFTPCTPPASSAPAFWKAPQREMPLSPGHVHVWRGIVALPLARLQVYQDTVSPDERDRAQRLITPEHQRRFTAARGMLRHILGRYLGTHPRDIRFGFGPRGKPFLRSPTSPTLHFNVAHSRHLAVYAISRDWDVGVDVEGGRDRADYRPLAERICSPEEFTMFQRLPRDAHKAAFFSCWTRKEACVKADGAGLGFRMKDLTVFFAPNEPPHMLNVRGAARQWALVNLPMEEGFWGALAITGQPARVLGWDYDR